MTENEIRERVRKYLEEIIRRPQAQFLRQRQLKFPRHWGVKKEYPVRFGSKQGYTDLVLLRNNKPFVIVECKRQGDVNYGKKQLESYLNATVARLGVFANHPDHRKWRYYYKYIEVSQIRFAEISQSEFNKKVWAANTTERDIETQAQQRKEQRIEARAQELTTREAVAERAFQRINQEAEKCVTENAIQGLLARQLQEKIKEQESIINKQQGEIESANSACIWGWILFVISVLILFVSHQ